MGLGGLLLRQLGDPKAEITEAAGSTGPARGLLYSKRVWLLLAWVAGALWAGSLPAVVCALRCPRSLRVASVAGASPSSTAARGPAGAEQGSPGLAEARAMNQHSTLPPCALRGLNHRATQTHRAAGRTPRPSAVPRPRAPFCCSCGCPPRRGRCERASTWHVSAASAAGLPST